MIKSKFLGNALQILGHSPCDHELHDMIIECDKEKSGNIYWVDFLTLVVRLKQEKEELEELTQIFKTFDHDDSGIITAAECRYLLLTATDTSSSCSFMEDETFSEDEIQEMIEETSDANYYKVEYVLLAKEMQSRKRFKDF